MSMSPEDVIELKHSLDGMAEILASYFRDLKEQSFTDQQALAIVLGWQRAAVSSAMGGERE
jgi:hypothetical protein